MIRYVLINIVYFYFFYFYKMKETSNIPINDTHLKQ